MKDLEKALNVKFQSTSVLTSIFTGNALTSGTNTAALFWDSAPEGATPPYLIAQVLQAPATSVYGGISFTGATIQFKSVANPVGTNSSRVLALSSLETFCGVFDEFVPVLASGVTVHTLRESEPMAMKLPQNEVGGKGHQAIVVYSYAVDP